MPFKIIHVIRNPFDNITTRYIKEASFSLGRKFTKEDYDPNSFEKFISGFRIDADTINRIKKSGDYSILDIQHEEFVKQPDRILSNLLDFLNFDSSDQYIEACADIAYDTPNKSRHQIQWTKEQIIEVDGIIQKYDFLKGYSYTS